MTIFILDSNFFIQAHRDTYPLDVAVSYWNKIKTLAKDGKIVTIDKVKNEIFKSEDDLSAWLKSNIEPHFYKTSNTPEVLKCYQEIAKWVNTKRDHYHQSAINEFLNDEIADAWLIAYAFAFKDSNKLVTYEISSPAKRSAIKIPDVCSQFGIDCLKPIEMFRYLKETF